jgi:hypothetical protein
MATRGRPTVRVTISPSERTLLEQWARRRTTAQGLAQRAQIVLACAAGRSNSEIAAELRITRQTAGRWRRRFVAKRLDGLLDEPRPGAPRRIVTPRSGAFGAPSACSRIEVRPSSCRGTRSSCTHKTARVRRWFARHPRFHVHFTPTSASWLNLVERWFALLSQKQIKRGAHRSVRALETAIREYVAITNDAPKPFVWTKTADEILAKVAGFCQRISKPGH